MPVDAREKKLTDEQFLQDVENCILSVLPLHVAPMSVIQSQASFRLAWWDWIDVDPKDSNHPYRRLNCRWRQ